MLNRYFSIYLGANLVPALVGFVAVTLYTRLLNPAEYGSYVVGMSVSGIVGAVFFVWVRLAVSRYQASSEAVDFRKTALVAFLASLAAALVISPAVILLVAPDIDKLIVAGSILVALSVGAFDIVQEFSRANLRPVRYAVAGILRSVLGLAFGWLAIRLGWGGVGLLGAVGLSFLVGTLTSLGGGGAKPARYRSDDLTKFMTYGLPLALGGLSIALYSTSDRLVVAYMLGDDAAGKFGVAADLPRQFMVMVASSVAAATFPVIFRAYSDDGAHTTRARLNDSVELLLAVVAPIAVWLALAADQVAGTLVGASFRTSVSVLLPILAVGRLLGVLNQFYLQISFQLAERPFLPLVLSIITLVVSVALMFPLVAEFGLIGAAYATLITEAVGVVVGFWMARRAFPLPLEPKRLAKVLTCVAMMAVAIVATRSVVHESGVVSLVVISVAGGLAYAAGALLLDLVHIRTAAMALFRLKTVS